MTLQTHEAPASGTLAPPPGFGALIYPRPAMQRAPEGRDVSGDEQSQAWLAALRGAGARRDQATARLHALLLRAARFELGRRRAALSYVRGEELDDIATQAADDALMAVLAKLDDYRGASRFTTWAYKFALLAAGVRLRRRAWQGREVVLDPRAGRPLRTRGRRRRSNWSGQRRSKRSAAPSTARSHRTSGGSSSRLP